MQPTSVQQILPDWKSERLLLSGADFLSHALHVIETAQAQLDLEFYIFDPGVMASEILMALRRASERGVKIRLLVDGVGAHSFYENFEAEIEDLQIEVKVYHPVPWHFTNFSVSLAWWPSTMFQLLGSVNSRNHRKVIISDSHTAIVGSFNVCDEHLPKDQGGADWLDAGAVIQGECVRFLVSAFEHAWEGWLGFHRSPSRWFGLRTYLAHQKSERYFLLNHTTRLRVSVRDRLFKKLRLATGRIWISTPYFAPSFKFIRLLTKAAARGVDVRLMIPMHNDVVFMHWVMKTYYESLLSRGIRIFEYQPSVLHAKIAVVDDWMAVGSTNLNSRSLFHDLEANYLLQMDSTKRQLESFLRKTFDESCVEIKDASRVTFVHRILGRIALIFKYWI